MDDELKQHLQEMETRIKEAVQDTETRLLRAFRNWALRIEHNLKVDRTTITGLEERMNNAESRLDDLEGQA